MKKFFYMAVAAIAALSSCGSDNDPIMGETGKQALTFTATMEGGVTRATLNSNKAEWAVGDQISINGVAYKAKTAGAATTFEAVTSGQEATLDGGKYKAYFPATMYNSTTVTLPASYTYADGGFDMPMYAESTTTALQFKNLCGVLAITVPSTQMSSVKSIVVSSDKQMNGALSSITAQGVLTFASATLTDAEKKVTLTASSAVSISSGNSKTFYVPVPAGTHNPLKITVSDGTNTKVMTTKKSGGVAVERNKIYPITFADNAAPAHEYVEIEAKYDGTNLTKLKWAKMNLGATAENKWGDFFAWGETEPRYTSYTRNGYAITAFEWKANYTSGYAAPFAEYSGTTLDAAHDAATANWGGTWRMPTQAEFKAMYNATKWTWNATDLGYYITPKGVTLAADKSNALLFLPGAGLIEGTTLKSGNSSSIGNTGFYRTSSLTTNTNSAYHLYFSNSSVNPSGSKNRYAGIMIRPVSD